MLREALDDVGLEAIPIVDHSDLLDVTIYLEVGVVVLAYIPDQVLVDHFVADACRVEHCKLKLDSVRIEDAFRCFLRLRARYHFEDLRRAHALNHVIYIDLLHAFALLSF